MNNESNIYFFYDLIFKELSQAQEKSSTDFLCQNVAYLDFLNKLEFVWNNHISIRVNEFATYAIILDYLNKIKTIPKALECKDTLCYLIDLADLNIPVKDYNLHYHNTLVYKFKVKYIDSLFEESINEVNLTSKNGYKEQLIKLLLVSKDISRTLIDSKFNNLINASKIEFLYTTKSNLLALHLLSLNEMDDFENTIAFTKKDLDKVNSLLHTGKMNLNDLKASREGYFDLLPIVHYVVRNKNNIVE